MTANTMENLEEQNKTELEKPAGTQAPKEEAVIHVIPDKFYGAGLKKKVPKEMKKEPAAIPPKPPTGAAVVTSPPPKKGKGGLIAVIAVVLVLLLGGGAAAYYFIIGPGKPSAPSEPVCGDRVCEEGETALSCRDDCGPPPAVCGNGTCEEGETYESCPDDCEAPGPICGDDKCEEGETPENCSEDCGPPPAVCGNGTCEEGETYESCPDDCEAPEPEAGTDTDSDGLTDLEERTVYGTDPRLSNTDRDNFVDLNEVLNLYDPNNPAPVPLSENPGISVYTNDEKAFGIFRPASWTVETGSTGSTIFRASTGEYIEVIVDELAEGDTLVDWYTALAPDVPAESIDVLATKKGYEFIISPNRMTAFVRAADRVYILSYSLNGTLKIQYRVTFEMMVNSLVFTGTP